MDKNLQLIWENCVDFMRDNLSAMEENADQKKLEESFEMLFSRVKPISLEDNNLTLEIPSDFYKEYIDDNYIALLSSALKKYIGRGVKLWYQNSPKGKQVKNQQVGEATKGFTIPPPESVQQVKRQLKGGSVVNPFAVPGIPRVQIESNLKRDYSFESYIEGDCNKLATNVAKSIARRPGSTAFNPLFLHGSYGVGKTHLGHAVGIEVKNLYPEKVVLYISSEKFIQQFVASSRVNKIADFVNFFQMVDVLIMDDIQFLSGKKATQDSFFHIFDFLHQSGKQIILTSDRAPVDISDIQERIVSRFKWGLTTEIKAPDFDTRRNIILDKLSRDGIVLPEDILDYLANEVQSSIRDLIGIINSVIAYSTVYKEELSLDFLKETIRMISVKEEKEITIPYIQEVVCDYFKIDKDLLLSKTRKREIVLPRQLAMYFAKELTSATYLSIGKQMGGKDHATVMHACETVKNTESTNKEVKKYVKELRDKLSC